MEKDIAAESLHIKQELSYRNTLFFIHDFSFQQNSVMKKLEPRRIILLRQHSHLESKAEITTLVFLSERVITAYQTKQYWRLP